MNGNEDLFQSSNKFKNQIERLVEQKWLFIWAIIICVIVAAFYNKYVHSTYENRAAVLVSNSNKALEDGSSNKNDQERIENEIGLLKSYNLINKTLGDLDFEITYYAEENLITHNTDKGSLFNVIREYYEEVPFQVVMDKSIAQPLNLRFYITFLPENKFRLEAEGTNITAFNYIDNKETGKIDRIKLDKVYQYGETISDKNLGIKILLKENGSTDYFNNKRLFFVFYHPDFLTVEYQKNLEVERANKNASILNITLKGNHPAKITDFLNALTSSYFDENLKSKNTFANSTIRFIDDQIAEATDSASITGSYTPGFKLPGKVTDLDYKSQQLIQKINQLDVDREQLSNKVKYYEYLRNSFRSNLQPSEILKPAEMNVSDASLAKLLNQLVQMNNERMAGSASTNAKDARIVAMDIQIKKLRLQIQDYVNTSLNTTKNTLRDMEFQISRMGSLVANVPKSQYRLLGSERKYKFNDAVYTYLLQRRYDALISRASSNPDYVLVEPAKIATAQLIAPRKFLNLLISCLIGFLLPLISFFIKDLFNNKIVDKYDLETRSNKPLIGYIFHNYKKTNTVIADLPKSSISESFRTVRTNLQIMSRGISKQVILVTSSGSGEGKSFISINLASVFALLGKKTLLLGFDLRKPGIYQDLGLKNIIGISSYLSSRAVLEDIVQPTRIEFLDFISAGPVPPNPIELIGSNLTKNMIFKLKEVYDYIIIDTSPIGVVTDAYFLMNYADLNIFVCRQNYTIKEMMGNTLKSLENNKITNIAILLNDIYLRSRAYAYGYDSNYYNDKEDARLNSVYRKILNAFKGAKKSRKKE